MSDGMVKTAFDCIAYVEEADSVVLLDEDGNKVVQLHRTTIIKMLSALPRCPYQRGLTTPPSPIERGEKSESDG